MNAWVCSNAYKNLEGARKIKSNRKIDGRGSCFQVDALCNIKYESDCDFDSCVNDFDETALYTI